jgi:hypothetical protein
MRRLALILAALVALAVPAAAQGEGYSGNNTTAGQNICPVIFGLSITGPDPGGNYTMKNHSGVYCAASDKPVPGSPTGNIWTKTRSRIWGNGVLKNDSQWGGGLGYRQHTSSVSAIFGFYPWNGRSDVQIGIDNFNGGNVKFSAQAGLYSGSINTGDGTPAYYECEINLSRTVKTCSFYDTDW